MLTLYYDLSCSPPTYDFVGALLTAELKRRELGEKHIRVVILPGPDHGFRQDNLPPRDPDERRRMLENIVVPMAGLLPSVKEVQVLDERPVGPHEPSIGFGEAIYGTHRIAHAFKELCMPLAPRSQILGLPQKYITITLREAPYHPARNSNLGEWLKVAYRLKDLGVVPIFVRDAAHAQERLGYRTAWRASLDLNHRAMLYSRAKLNLFVNNGPAWFCMAMGLPTFICKMVTDGAPACDPAFFRSVGWEPGQQIPGAIANQRVLWMNDNAIDILDEVERHWDLWA